MCGNTESSKYYRHKGKNGSWDRKSYMCQSCYDLLRRYGTIDKDKIEDFKRQYIKKRIEINLEKKRCCICGKTETYKRPDGTYQWCKDYDNNDNWTGRYQCCDCNSIIRQRKPDSQANVIRSMRKSRIGSISLKDSNAKGVLIEVVIAKVRDLKVLSIVMDNFRYMLDLSIDKEYGIIQSKGRVSKYGEWKVGYIGNKEFDYIFIVCMDRKWSIIERIYAIPKEEIFNLSGITIYENPSRGSKWEKFRLKDISQYNNVYHSLTDYLKDKELFGIEDIKKWLDMHDMAGLT